MLPRIRIRFGRAAAKKAISLVNVYHQSFDDICNSATLISQNPPFATADIPFPILALPQAQPYVSLSRVLKSWLLLTFSSFAASSQFTRPCTDYSIYRAFDNRTRNRHWRYSFQGQLLLALVFRRHWSRLGFWHGEYKQQGGG